MKKIEKFIMEMGKDIICPMAISDCTDGVPCSECIEQKRKELLRMCEEDWEGYDVSEMEKELLALYLKHGFRWLARDKNGWLYFFRNRPVMVDGVWVMKNPDDEGTAIRQTDDLYFGFVKWETPYSVEEILKNCKVKNRKG